MHVECFECMQIIFIKSRLAHFQGLMQDACAVGAYFPGWQEIHSWQALTAEQAPVLH